MHYEWITRPDGSTAYVQVTDEPKPIPSEPAPLPPNTCTVCGKSFKTALALQGHKRSPKCRT